MKAVTKILAGAAGVAAAVAFATPAAAQGYPYPYGYGNNGGVLGQVLNGILNPYGQNRYGQSPYGYGYGGQQQQIDACARAVEQRINGMSRYGQNYGGYGGYNNGYGNARVVAVTQIERHSDGIKVRGEASSGMAAGYGGYGVPNYGYGAPGYGAPGYGYNSYGAAADISFSCRIRSNYRISDINLYDRRTGRQIG